ncbi:MAG: hypothetical protein IJE66_03025 [Akkermansia sp.]|nr:hypothetical protein [Akkermansia sp.]
MARSFEEIIGDIVSRHEDYAPDAYDFLRQALDHSAQRFKQDRKTAHLSAEELYLGVCSLALEEYGPMAKSVLEYWGILSSVDVGEIVFRLIEVGVFGKQEGDTINQFYHLPALSTILDAPYATPAAP